MGAAEKLSFIEIADRLDELPALPSIVYELGRVINDPMSSTAEVEKIMATDQSLTSKVLRLANSAYYSVPGGVTGLQRAIGYIGFDSINQLVLSASTMTALKAESSDHFSVREFWKHSLGVAMAAETTAKFTGFATPSDLFTCGLLHDMGKIATLIVAPNAFGEILSHARRQSVTMAEAEAILGLPSHALVGQELAIKWRLPALLRESVAHHHQIDPALRSQGLSDESHRAIDIVLLSNLLVHGLRFGHGGHEQATAVPKVLLTRLGIEPEQRQELVHAVKTTLQSADRFLRIIAG